MITSSKNGVMSFQKGMSEGTFTSTMKWASEYMNEFLEEDLARVRKSLKEKGKEKNWECCADGFYHIRGHHSPNGSVALYDLETGEVAFAMHACKKGKKNFHG